jgi:hypothetical protein
MYGRCSNVISCSVMLVGLRALCVQMMSSTDLVFCMSQVDIEHSNEPGLYLLV